MPCGPTFSHRDNELDEDKEEVPPVQERPWEQYYGDEEYELLVRHGMPRMIPRAPRFSRWREESESDSDSDSEGDGLQHGRKGKEFNKFRKNEPQKEVARRWVKPIVNNLHESLAILHSKCCRHHHSSLLTIPLC
jgi:hypothetical protein